MDTPFLSIIMPVYKAETYIRQSIDSIKSQTFKNWELILINDGSPDRCGAICDEYSAADSRISVIHFETNQGVRVTRNVAMQQAKGRYTTFVDADDEIASYTYQKIYDTVQDTLPHVVVFGVEERYYDRDQALKDSRVITLPGRYFASQDELRPYVIELEKTTLYGYLWNKLYDTAYIKCHEIVIRDYAIASDFFFNCDFFMDIESMQIMDMAPYVYNRRIDEGLTSRFFPNFYQIQEERVLSVLHQYEYWGICTDEIKTTLADIFVRYVFAGLQRCFDPRANMSGKDRRNWVENVYGSELYQQLMPYSHPQNRVLKVMSGLLKRKATGSVVAAGRTMFTVKNNLPLLFAKVKQNR